MALWTPTDKVKVTKIKEEGCVVSFSIEIPAEKVQEAMENSLVQVQSRVTLPGFRLGKAPLQLVKQHFNPDVKERAMHNMLKAILPGLYKDNNFRPLTPPLLSSAKIEEGQPFSCRLEFECAPNVDPKNYSGMLLLKPRVEATEDRVDDEIKYMLEHNAFLEPSDENVVVGREHFVIVDYAGYVDGQEIPGSAARGELVDMSAPQTIAGLSEAITGGKKGETREFTADYAGKKAVFKATLAAIKRKVVPVFDEKFAADMGFKSAAEFRASIKEALLKQAGEQSEKELLRQIEDHILKENQIPVPPTMVERQIDLMIGHLKDKLRPEEREKLGEEKEKELKTKFKPAAERDLRLGYLMDSIAQKEKLEATEQDFLEELENRVNAVSDADEKRQIKDFFESKKTDIMAAITEKKTVLFLKTQSIIKEG